MYRDLTFTFVLFLKRLIIASPVHVISMLLVSAILIPSLVNVKLVLLVQDLNVEVTIDHSPFKLNLHFCKKIKIFVKMLCSDILRFADLPFENKFR